MSKRPLVSRHTLLLFIVGMCLAFFGLRAAFADDEEKKKLEQSVEKFQGGERELSKVENKDDDGNPLNEILKLMDQVHKDLIDMETDKPVQEREEEIVELLGNQGKVKSKLDDLIKSIENSMKMGGSSSGAGQMEVKGAKSNRGKQNKHNSKSNKNKMTRNKDRIRQSSDPKTSSTLPPKNQKESQDSSKLNTKPPVYNNNGESGAWGSLPGKLFGDLEQSNNRPVPEKFKKQVEGYMKALSKPKVKR